MQNNFIIGTANLTSIYGVKKNQLSKNNLKKILNFLKLKKKKIIIETSLRYRYAIKTLEKINLNDCLIINKIPPIKNIEDEKKILHQLIKQKNKFNIKNFFIVLGHNEDFFTNKYCQKNINFLKKLKKNKITKNIGVSIYSKKNAYKIIKKFKPDYLQVPTNIFDRRFLNKNFLDKMKENSIKVQFRSVFLQGLLAGKSIIENNSLPKKLNTTLLKYYNWISDNKLDPVEACLNFIALKKLKNIVIGVNSFKQLKEIINFKKRKYKYPTFSIKQKDKNLILRLDKWNINL